MIIRPVVTRLIPALVFFSFISSKLLSQDISIEYAQKMDTVFMRSVLETLTSDSLGGRETGRIGQQRAALFLAEKFTSFGLQSASQDTFQYHCLSNRANYGFNLLANESYFCFGKDFFYLSGEGDSAYSWKESYFLGSALEHYPKNTERIIKGNPVIYLQTSGGGNKSQNSDHLNELSRIAQFDPAVVFIVTDFFHETFDSLSRAERRNSPIIKTLKSLPCKIVWMKPEVLNAMNKRLIRQARNQTTYFRPMKVKSELSLKTHSDTKRFYGQNVPFLLKGTKQTEEIVVVNAHYDHLGIEGDTIHYGADDDASGTTAVVEIARLFAKAAADGHAPKRSILFMPVSGEEKGLLGSLYYSLHPLFPLENTVADVNIDMVGRTDPEHDSLGIGRYVYVIGSDMLSSQLREINEAANKKLPKLELDYRFDDPNDPNRFYYRSDHYNFAKQGVPSVFYFNGVHEDYHQPTDTPDKIRYDLLAQRSQLVFLTIWELANRDKRIVVDRQPVNNR